MLVIGIYIWGFFFFNFLITGPSLGSSQVPTEFFIKPEPDPDLDRNFFF